MSYNILTKDEYLKAVKAAGFAYGVAYHKDKTSEVTARLFQDYRDIMRKCKIANPPCYKEVARAGYDAVRGEI